MKCRRKRWLHESLQCITQYKKSLPSWLIGKPWAHLVACSTSQIGTIRGSRVMVWCLRERRGGGFRSCVSLRRWEWKEAGWDDEAADALTSNNTWETEPYVVETTLWMRAQVSQPWGQECGRPSPIPHLPHGSMGWGEMPFPYPCPAMSKAGQRVDPEVTTAGELAVPDPCQLQNIGK